MNKPLLVLGMLWALPLTLFSFIYILPLWSLGKYKFMGWDERAWFWSIDVNGLGMGWIDKKLKNAWQGWAGSTMGNAIVIKVPGSLGDDWYRKTVIHEKEHVLQMMKLGIFYPVTYVMVWLIGRFICNNTNGYYDSIYEIDARRKADIVIDANMKH